MPSLRRLLFLAGLAGLAIAYLRKLRPWQLTWGATPDEVTAAWPSDDLVPQPTFDATRAITIHARPESIWPWLVQVGVGRGGWYSYDVLDNLGRPSAWQVLPEFQTLAPGDMVPMSPDGSQGIRVLSIDAPRTMVWGTPDDTTWVWQLVPRPDGSTRLLTRVRARYRWTSPAIAFSALLEFGDIWMMRRMLLNVRERAEELEASTAAA
jgi:hypothetical protein